MILEITAIIMGLAILVWSADRFVDSASVLASHLGMPPLLIGMLVIGFGTSAPEMVVSAISSYQGNPGIALGNAYGSNITNIGLVLGLTALIRPVIVQSSVLRKELPILIGVTLLSYFLLFDEFISLSDAWILLAAFGILMSWSAIQGRKKKDDPMAEEVEEELQEKEMSTKMALLWLMIGLVLLVGSSRILVWGAVAIATKLGVSDLVIGLTVVAIGTSLPELASSIAASRKGEHDMVFGNIIGSNLFNTLGVVGIAGAIHPLAVDPVVMTRDMFTMGVLTLSLFIFGYGWKKGEGQVNRIEGGILVFAYVGYTFYLFNTLT